MTTASRAVFFDWDGTLADTATFLEMAHNSARTHLGFDILEVGLFKQYFGQDREKVFAAFYPGKIDAGKAAFTQFVTEHRTKHLRAIDGASALLESLTQDGYRIGIVSNKRPELLEQEIVHLGWQSMFATVVGSGEAPRDKPHPDPLLLAMERLRVDPADERIYYIGDSEFDIACARAAGCVPVYIRDHDGHNPDPENNPDIVMVEDLLALRGLVLKP